MFTPKADPHDRLNVRALCFWRLTGKRSGDRGGTGYYTQERSSMAAGMWSTISDLADLIAAERLGRWREIYAVPSAACAARAAVTLHGSLPLDKNATSCGAF